MPTGRNDPCPCGSGKKYKHCCLPREANAARAELENAMREAAANAPEWEVDAIPLMTRFEDGRSPRPVLMLVVAGDVVIHHDIRGHLRGELTDIAAALEAAVIAAARVAGAFPESVRVRHEETAAALAPLLAGRDIDVSGGDVHELEDVARPLVDAIAGSAMWPPVCRPDTWSAWDLPPTLTAAAFRAAAEFHARAPWKVMANLQAPRAIMPSGREWTCGVLGNAGMEFGLVLCSVESDLFELTNAMDRSEPFRWVQGRILSLAFEHARDAGDIRREARLHRWDVAENDAIPVLTTVNTPAGGATQEDIRDMIAILTALPLFAKKHARVLMKEETTGRPIAPIEWREPKSGILFDYDINAVSGMTEDDDDDVAFEMPPGTSGIPEAFKATVQRTIEEMGPDASHDEILAALNRSLGEAARAQNDAPQSDCGGLTPNQLQRLLDSDWQSPSSAIRIRTDLEREPIEASHILSNARTLLAYVTENGPLGATSAANLKLDAVAALADRMILPDGYMDMLRKYSKRITEQDVWPLHLIRIVCEDGGLITRTGARFTITAAGRELSSPDRAPELYAHLFYTWFRRIDLDYGGRWPWPELQQQLAYTLYRLPAEAREWITADDLVDRVVLPFAMVHAPVIDSLQLNLAGSALTTGVLHALTGFGFMEEKKPTGDGSISLFRITRLASEALVFDV